MGEVERRLEALGIALPEPPRPAASYVPWVRTGQLVYVAGQVPSRDGAFLYRGRVGDDLDLQAAREAARLVAVNLLAQVRAACDGDLDRVRQVVKLNGFVQAVPHFEDHPKVIDAASELMAQAFGEAGRHARSAVGVAGLPFGVAVEIDGVFELEP